MEKRKKEMWTKLKSKMKKRREKSEEIHSKTKRCLKHGSENFSFILKMRKQRILKKHRKERKLFFLKYSFNWREMWENIFGELFFQKWWETQTKTQFLYFLFLWWKNIKKGKKETKPDSEKGEKGWWIEKEGERINNIFQDVCFLNPSLTSHQKGKNKEKRFKKTKLQKHVERELFV